MRREDLGALVGAGTRARVARVVAFIVVTAGLEALVVMAVYPFLIAATRSETVGTSGLLALLYDLSGAGTMREFLMLLGGGILLLVVLANVVGAAAAWQQQRFIREFEHETSSRLLRSFLARPYPFFLRRNSAELQRMLIQDCHAVTTGVLEPALEIISRSVAALAIFAVLLFVQPAVTVSALVVFGLIYGVVYVFGRTRLARLGERVHAASKEAAKAAAEALSSIKMLKVVGREEQFLARFERADRRAALDYARESMFARLPRFLIEGLVMIAVVVTLLAIIGSGGDLVAYLPTIGMFALAAFRLMPAIHGIVTSVGRLRFNESFISGIARELSDSDGVRPPTPLRPLPFHREIRLVDVRFSYDNERRPVLQGIDLVVRKGTTVALVGRTGSGKSTVVDIVLGLLRPDAGELLVDGEAVTGERVAAWQRRVSYVPQQVVLLDDTLARNIAFGLSDDEIDMDRVRRACEAANILDFVEKELPEGFATIVGERGVRLSGGQRQRIGIARALYEDREVIVFDEATSEVDAMTERAINEAIEAMAHRKTIIIVAHRFSAIRSSDEIYVLDAGRVVGRGSYDELLTADAAFRRMAEGQ